MPLPDAEALAVQWAKANTELATLLSGRISTNLPKDPTFPFLTVMRVAGGPDDSEAPLDQPYLQWDCFGKKGEYTPDYETAYNVGAVLVEQAKYFPGGPVGGFGYIYGFNVLNGPRRFDEPRTGWARFIVEMTMTSR